MADKKDASKSAGKSGGKSAPAKKTGGAASSGDSKKRLTQTEIVNHLADKSGLKRAQAKEFMNELANLAMGEVKRSGEFTMPGFGKLVLSQRKEREGRNPATGAKITIPAKTTLKFRLGKAMKDSVGGK
ncbi:MAG: HU family DNA-binding protein [Pyrinomonadaceae bacterium]